MFYLNYKECLMKKISLRLLISGMAIAGISSIAFADAAQNNSQQATKSESQALSNVWDMLVQNLYLASPDDKIQQESLAFMLITLEQQKHESILDFQALERGFNTKYGLPYEDVNLRLPRLDVCEQTLINVGKATGLKFDDQAKGAALDPAVYENIKNQVDETNALMQCFLRFKLAYLTLINECKPISFKSNDVIKLYNEHKAADDDAQKLEIQKKIDVLAKPEITDRLTKLKTAFTAYRSAQIDLTRKLAETRIDSTEIQQIKTKKEKSYKKLDAEASSLIGHWEAQLAEIDLRNKK